MLFAEGPLWSHRFGNLFVIRLERLKETNKSH